jgi:hypothetical protein
LVVLVDRQKFVQIYISILAMILCGMKICFELLT